MSAASKFHRFWTETHLLFESFWHLNVVSPLFSTTGNAAMLWCACSTSAFKSVTSRFVKNLACSGICAGLTCVPFDIALGLSPHCCWWLHTLVVCKAIKFLQKLYCSVTVLSFSTIALDRLEQKDIAIVVLNKDYSASIVTNIDRMLTKQLIMYSVAAY